MESDVQHEPTMSRRGLVRSAAGAAVLGTAAVAAARTPAQARTSPETRPNGRTAPATPPARDGHPAAGETVVVHVRDARTGDLDIYVGERHVHVRDRDLASRLLAAAR